MSISKLVNWMDDVDPYMIQRLAVGKAVFMATVLVFVYWVFRPVSFSAFIMPAILVYYYGNTLIQKAKEKERLLLFIYAAFIVGNVTFYLVYPFKVIFFYYALMFFMFIYFLLELYFNQLKSVAMLILAYSLVTLSDTPPANFQVVFNLFFSSILSIITIFICLRIYPNDAIQIWSRAMQKFLACMEKDIDRAIQGQPKRHDAEEVKHLSIIRAFRKMISKSEFGYVYRISINIRNIQFALNNLIFEVLNVEFWQAIQAKFRELRTNMDQRKTCSFPTEVIAQTPLEHYVMRCLKKAINNWNQVCYIQKH